MSCRGTIMLLERACSPPIVWLKRVCSHSIGLASSSAVIRAPRRPTRACTRCARAQRGCHASTIPLRPTRPRGFRPERVRAHVPRPTCPCPCGLSKHLSAPTDTSASCHRPPIYFQPLAAAMEPGLLNRHLARLLCSPSFRSCRIPRASPPTRASCVSCPTPLMTET